MFKITFFLTLIIAIILFACFFIFQMVYSVLYIAIFMLIFNQAFLTAGLFWVNNPIIKSIKGKQYFKNSSDSKSDKILLKFDDGPHPVFTPIILDILKTYNVKAIFFVCGENAFKYPEMLLRIKEEGHQIGNHTYSHPYNFALLGYQKLKQDIQKANDIVKKITGIKPEYFTPPMGHKNLHLTKVLFELDLKLMLWDINSNDTRYSQKQIEKHLIKKLSKKSNNIVLFHDGIYKWTKESRLDTVEVLKNLLNGRIFRQ